MKKYYFDTESCGFYGPTILLQYSINRQSPSIHNIWNSSVQTTLDIVEDMMESCMVGFNLVHEGYHLTKTYNILKELPRLHKPDVLDYRDIELSAESRTLCLKPRACCDLMLVGRKTKFQAVLNQKPIVLRKVPIKLVSQLKIELAKIDIPSIYFAKSKKKGYEWNIVPLHKGTSRPMKPEDVLSGEEQDPDFCDLKLIFAPTTALKAIMEYIGYSVIYHEDLNPLKYPEEYEYWPHFGGWMEVFDSHLYAWTHDTKRLTYANDDVTHLFALEDYLECSYNYPFPGDTDSTLSFGVGAQHWKGFSVDIDKINERLRETTRMVAEVTQHVNINSQKQVKNWLVEVATPIDKALIVDTAAETLREIVDSYSDDAEAMISYQLIHRCNAVLRARKADKEKKLYEYLLNSGNMYVVNKIIGTKSNRMSGGSEDYVKTRGAINPQGIKKGPEIRSCFPLAPKDLSLDGGDFSGYEVCIAEAVYKDVTMTQELDSGKKMHGLFGAEMYGISYEEVMATEDLNINHPNGIYQRAKRGYFALLYDAQEDTLSESMWITRSEAKAGIERFLAKYRQVKEHREKIKERFTAIIQLAGPGSPVLWKEPSEYIESFLGHRRYFTLEYSIMKQLFQLAREPTLSMKEIGQGTIVQRRQRNQTACGATSSSLYQCIFGLQNQIIRAACNHEIQSPGGELCKKLQAKIYNYQPTGIHPWHVMILNMHDELDVVRKPELGGKIRQTVNEFIEMNRCYVPRLSMKWKSNIKNWGEK